MSRPELDIRIDDLRWQALGLDALALAACTAALDKLGIAGPCEISLLATNDAAIQELNSAFRGQAKPTNVLSWPAEALTPPAPGQAPPRPTLEELGDIAIAYETCMQEASEQGKSGEDHVTHMIIHATFHLLGYDHETDADASLMERLETEALANLGVDNPY